jgi:ABC-2 type transport system permease protein
MIFTIAAKELRALFLSPLAWAILCAVQIVVAFIFLQDLSNYIDQQANINPETLTEGASLTVIAKMYATVGFMMILVVPLMTMRMIADERRQNTLALLLSSPITSRDIVLGKFAGVMGFFTVMHLLLTLMPLSLFMGGWIDSGIVSANILALFLLLCSFSAIGLYFSTLTSEPAVAAATTLGTLLLLWILNIVISTADGFSWLGYLSAQNHYGVLLQGVFSSMDIIYFLILIFLFLILAIRRLNYERIQL